MILLKIAHPVTAMISDSSSLTDTITLSESEMEKTLSQYVQFTHKPITRLPMFEFNDTVSWAVSVEFSFNSNSKSTKQEDCLDNFFIFQRMTHTIEYIHNYSNIASTLTLLSLYKANLQIQ